MHERWLGCKKLGNSRRLGNQEICSGQKFIIKSCYSYIWISASCNWRKMSQIKHLAQLNNLQIAWKSFCDVEASGKGGWKIEAWGNREVEQWRSGKNRKHRGTSVGQEIWGWVAGKRCWEIHKLGLIFVAHMEIFLVGMKIFVTSTKIYLSKMGTITNGYSQKFIMLCILHHKYCWNVDPWKFNI